MNAPATYQEVITANISGYITEFNKHSKKSIESYLEMCRVVWIAKQKLMIKEFLQFCEEIGESGSKGSISKMRAIGKQYNLFKEHIEQLPSAWTTLYTLATMPESVLENYLTDKTISNQMDGKQAKALLPPKVKADKQSEGTAVANEISAVDDDNKECAPSDCSVSMNSAGDTPTPNVKEDPSEIVQSCIKFTREFMFRVRSLDDTSEFEERLTDGIYELCSRLNADLFEFDEVKL